MITAVSRKRPINVSRVKWDHGVKVENECVKGQMRTRCQGSERMCHGWNETTVSRQKTNASRVNWDHRLKADTNQCDTGEMKPEWRQRMTDVSRVKWDRSVKTEVRRDHCSIVEKTYQCVKGEMKPVSRQKTNVSKVKWEHGVKLVIEYVMGEMRTRCQVCDRICQVWNKNTVLSQCSNMCQG